MAGAWCGGFTGVLCAAKAGVKVATAVALAEAVAPADG